MNMVTLWVCLNCDRQMARVHTAEAEGRAWFKYLKKSLQGTEGLQVKSANCLGGCESNVPEGSENGCCTVGLGADGKYSYVLNRFAPDADNAKLMELLDRYRQFEDGRLRCSERPDLSAHIATRLPPRD